MVWILEDSRVFPPHPLTQPWVLKILHKMVNLLRFAKRKGLHLLKNLCLFTDLEIHYKVTVTCPFPTSGGLFLSLP